VSSEDIFGSAADPEIKAALHKTTFDKLMRATVGAGGYTGDLDETDAYATDENGSNADVVKVLYDRMQKAGGTTNFSPQEMAYLQENFGAYNSSDSPTMPSYDSSVGSPARGSPHASVQSGPPLADGRIPIMGYIDPNHLQQSMEQSGIRVGTTGSSPNQG
jgi:hypothetical protein